MPPCRSIHAMIGKREFKVRNHPRYRLHVLTSRGSHLLRRDTRLRSPLGYAGAFFTNVVSRKTMSSWIERVAGVPATVCRERLSNAALWLVR